MKFFKSAYKGKVVAYSKDTMLMQVGDIITTIHNKANVDKLDNAYEINDVENAVMVFRDLRGLFFNAYTVCGQYQPKANGIDVLGVYAMLDDAIDALESHYPYARNRHEVYSEGELVYTNEG